MLLYVNLTAQRDTLFYHKSISVLSVFKFGKILFIASVLNLGFFIPPSAMGISSDFDADVPPQVWSVDFEGNQTFPNMVLNNNISTEAPTIFGKLKFWNRFNYELNETEVKKDIIRLRNYYQRRGFVNAEVSYRIETGNKEWKKNIIFVIDENVPVRIENLKYNIETEKVAVEEVAESESFKRVQRQHILQPGNRYQGINEPEVVGRFQDVLKNLGFPYAEVNIIADVDTSALTADLTIEAVTGPRAYIDSIQVEGAQSLDKDYIVREAALSEGEMYTMDKIQDAQQQVFNHHMFRFATIAIPEQPRDSSLTLNMRIKENELRSVELLAGFGTEEKLRGRVSWMHRNVFKKGHRFTSSVRASFIEQTLSLNYLFPYFYNTKSSIVISPFIQHLLEGGYELYQGGVTNSYIYRYSQYTTASAAYEFTKNIELTQQSNASLPDTTREFDLSSFQFSALYSEGLGRQSRGWMIQPSAEISGLFGMATFEFQKLSLDVRRFTQLSSSTTLATRIQGGGIFNVSSDSLPVNVRFYLGGTNSVRGWFRQELGPKRVITENGNFVEYIPVGGRSFFSFNLELRQELNSFIRGFGVAGFLDGGQVWRSVRSIGETRPLQFGAGGGIRYQSPIGPLRIDIGYKINPTETDVDIYRGEDFGNAWSRIGIHLSIGQAF